MTVTANRRTGSHPFTWRTLTFRSTAAGEWKADIDTVYPSFWVERSSRRKGPRQYTACAVGFVANDVLGHGPTPLDALDDMVRRNVERHQELARIWEEVGR